MKDLLVRILVRLNLLHYLNLTITKERTGNRVIVPILNSLGKENLRLSEKWMCEVIEKLLPIKNGGFIDIGVNLAQTLIKLKLVSNAVPYVGFDPNPVCIYYAKEVAKRNKYSNVTLIPVGLSNQSQLIALNFYNDGNSDSAASIIKDFRPDRIFRQEYVACFDFRDIHSLIDFPASIVKIDVEGAELEVLRGITPLLESQRPFVLIEILPAYSSANAVRMNRQQAIEEIVRSVRYTIMHIKKSDGSFVSFEALTEIGVNTEPEDSDYLLCPEEFHDVVM